MAHYVNTNGQGGDLPLYNYSTWSYAMRSLDTFLAAEIFNTYSPPNSPVNSPLLVPPRQTPLTANRPLLTWMEASLPSLPPSSPLPLSPLPSEHDSDQENDPQDILLHEWEEYDPNNSNHYPITYIDKFG